MRKLMWFTLGFTGAIALCAYWLSGVAVLILALCLAAVSFALLLHNSPRVAIVAMALFGMAAGFLYQYGYTAWRLAPLQELDGTDRYLSVTATDYGIATDYGTRVDGKAELAGRTVKLRVYLQGEYTVHPGDTFQTELSLRYTPGRPGEGTYQQAEGIFLVGHSYDSVAVIPAQSSGLAYFAAHLRRAIAQRIDALFPEQTGFFAKALLLGDDRGISVSDNVALQKSGIRHVVAVSGLHVSILLSVLYFFTGRKKLPTVLIGMPLLLLFAALAGFSPSVVRACIMHGLIILAFSLEREYDPPTAIAFSALVMLVYNPLVITSVSFQLSMSCVIGIFAFSEPIRLYLMDEKRLGKYKKKTWRGRLIRWFTGSVSISLSTLLTTVPLCAVYFEMVSLVGIVTNLLTLWVISFVFCGIILACLVSLIWLPAGTAVAWVVSAPIQYVLWIARGLSRVSFGVAYTHSVYTVAWIIFTYGLLAVFFLSKGKRPVLLAGGILTLYALCLLLSWAEPRLDPVRMTVVDVGQGQCILLQSRDKTYMVDCGGDDGYNAATQAMKWLHAQGVFHLDGLIITHYDLDHCNGVESLLSLVDTDMLYLPDRDPEHPFRQALTLRGDRITWVRQEQQLDLPTGSLRLFPAPEETTGNESSMCILFQGETCDILITGDLDQEGEALLLQRYDLQQVSVLVAGHHGAQTSTGVALLHAVKPQTAVISVGAENRNGHPDPQTLLRLQRIGCRIRRTDLEGTIVIRG